MNSDTILHLSCVGQFESQPSELDIDPLKVNDTSVEHVSAANDNREIGDGVAVSVSGQSNTPVHQFQLANPARTFPVNSKRPLFFNWLTSETCTKPLLSGNWSIKKLLPAEGLAVMFGKPGCGKSLVAADIGLHIADGMDWRGHRTRQSGVSYVSSEGGRSAGNRVHAWIQHNGVNWPKNFRMSPISLDLRSNEKDALALIEDIRDEQADCGLVIIDTLSRNLAGGNENAPEDMGAFVKHCDMIANCLKCLVLIIHHSGKDETRGARGHTSLLGAVSTELEVKRAQGSSGIIKVTKQRDAEDGGEYGFDLKEIELGLDEDGETVSSAVAIADSVKHTVLTPGGSVQRTVFNALTQFILEYGQPNPTGAGFPEQGRVQVVERDAFIQFAAGRMTQKDGPKSVRRAITGLINRNCVALNGDKLWIASASFSAQ